MTTSPTHIPRKSNPEFDSLLAMSRISHHEKCRYQGILAVVGRNSPQVTKPKGKMAIPE